ncbi:hypothetical protein NOZE110980_13045 [Nocardioides zeicaulis]
MASDAVTELGPTASSAGGTDRQRQAARAIRTGATIQAASMTTSTCPVGLWTHITSATNHSTTPSAKVPPRSERAAGTSRTRTMSARSTASATG